MAIDIQRREAFSRAFHNYPKYIRLYALENCSLVNPLTGDTPAMTEDDFFKIMQVIMAQFAVRLIQTRADKSTPEMTDFAEETVRRYKDFQTSLVGACAIVAEPNIRKAFSLIEANMAETIFSALVHEVVIKEKDKEGPEFVEIDFWRDVFLSIIANQGMGKPQWYVPLQAVVLSHMQEFRKALEAVPVNG